MIPDFMILITILRILAYQLEKENKLTVHYNLTQKVKTNWRQNVIS